MKIKKRLLEELVRKSLLVEDTGLDDVDDFDDGSGDYDGEDDFDDEVVAPEEYLQQLKIDFEELNLQDTVSEDDDVYVLQEKIIRKLKNRVDKVQKTADILGNTIVSGYRSEADMSKAFLAYKAFVDNPKNTSIDHDMLKIAVGVKHGGIMGPRADTVTKGLMLAIPLIAASVYSPDELLIGKIFAKAPNAAKIIKAGGKAAKYVPFFRHMWSLGTRSIYVVKKSADISKLKKAIKSSRASRKMRGDKYSRVFWKLEDEVFDSYSTKIKLEIRKLTSDIDNKDEILKVTEKYLKANKKKYINSSPEQMIELNRKLVTNELQDLGLNATPKNLNKINAKNTNLADDIAQQKKAKMAELDKQATDADVYETGLESDIERYEKDWLAALERNKETEFLAYGDESKKAAFYIAAGEFVLVLTEDLWTTIINSVTSLPSQLYAQARSAFVGSFSGDTSIAIAGYLAFQSEQTIIKDLGLNPVSKGVSEIKGKEGSIFGGIDYKKVNGYMKILGRAVQNVLMLGPGTGDTEESLAEIYKNAFWSGLSLTYTSPEMMTSGFSKRGGQDYSMQEIRNAINGKLKEYPFLGDTSVGNLKSIEQGMIAKGYDSVIDFLDFGGDIDELEADYEAIDDEEGGMNESNVVSEKRIREIVRVMFKKKLVNENLLLEAEITDNKKLLKRLSNILKFGTSTKYLPLLATYDGSINKFIKDKPIYPIGKSKVAISSRLITGKSIIKKILRGIKKYPIETVKTIGSKKGKILLCIPESSLPSSGLIQDSGGNDMTGRLRLQEFVKLLWYVNEYKHISETTSRIGKDNDAGAAKDKINKIINGASGTLDGLDLNKSNVLMTLLEAEIVEDGTYGRNLLGSDDAAIKSEFVNTLNASKDIIEGGDNATTQNEVYKDPAQFGNKIKSSVKSSKYFDDTTKLDLKDTSIDLIAIDSSTEDSSLALNDDDDVIVVADSGYKKMKYGDAKKVSGKIYKEGSYDKHINSGGTDTLEIDEDLPDVDDTPGDSSILPSVGKEGTLVITKEPEITDDILTYFGANIRSKYNEVVAKRDQRMRDEGISSGSTEVPYDIIELEMQRKLFLDRLIALAVDKEAKKKSSSSTFARGRLASRGKDDITIWSSSTSRYSKDELSSAAILIHSGFEGLTEEIAKIKWALTKEIRDYFGSLLTTVGVQDPTYEIGTFVKKGLYPEFAITPKGKANMIDLGISNSAQQGLVSKINGQIKNVFKRYGQKLQKGLNPAQRRQDRKAARKTQATTLWVRLLKGDYFGGTNVVRIPYGTNYATVTSITSEKSDKIIAIGNQDVKGEQQIKLAIAPYRIFTFKRVGNKVVRDDAVKSIEVHMKKGEDIPNLTNAIKVKDSDFWQKASEIPGNIAKFTSDVSNTVKKPIENIKEKNENKKAVLNSVSDLLNKLETDGIDEFELGLPDSELWSGLNTLKSEEKNDDGKALYTDIILSLKTANETGLPTFKASVKRLKDKKMPLSSLSDSLIRRKARNIIVDNFILENKASLKAKLLQKKRLVERVNIGRTGEVPFDWGSYYAKYKDDDYYSISDNLGTIQRFGDPFTYGEDASGIYVYSAPERYARSVGAYVNSDTEAKIKSSTWGDDQYAGSEVETIQDDIDSDIVDDLPSLINDGYETVIFGDSQSNDTGKYYNGTNISWMPTIGKILEDTYQNSVRVSKAGKGPSYFVRNFDKLIFSKIGENTKNIFITLGGNTSNGVEDLVYKLEASLAGLKSKPKVHWIGPPPPAFDGVDYDYNDHVRRRLANNERIKEAVGYKDFITYYDSFEILSSEWDKPGYYSLGKLDGIHITGQFAEDFLELLYLIPDNSDDILKMEEPQDDVPSEALDDDSDQVFLDQLVLLGLEPGHAYAIQKNESTSHGSLAFNPDNFIKYLLRDKKLSIDRKNAYAGLYIKSGYYDLEEPLNGDYVKAYKNSKIPDKAYYSIHRNETGMNAYRAAYALSPENAIKATAWGTYQVLGDVLLDLNSDYESAVAMFLANPKLVSRKMFIGWLQKPSKKGFIPAMKKGDWSEAARLYYGSSTSKYGKRYAKDLEKHYNEYMSL